MEGHGELLNEGVEVLGSLPAVLEETGHLFNVIKMQMGRMEGGEKKKRDFLEKTWQETIATPLGSCSCFVVPLLLGPGGTPTKGQAQPMGSWIPQIFGMQDWPLVRCKLISLGTSPAGSQILGVSGSQPQLRSCSWPTRLPPPCLSFPTRELKEMTRHPHAATPASWSNGKGEGMSNPCSKHPRYEPHG